MNQGESAWTALERGCRMAGLLAYADPSGDLVLTEPETLLTGSAIEVSLVEGENVLKARLTQDFSERFGKYIVRGQRPGTDTSFGEDAAHVEGVSLDRGFALFDERNEEIPLQRNKVIVAEGAVDQALATQRAAWESTVRLARTNTLELEVATLTVDPSLAISGPWQVNRLFWTILPSLSIRRILLISRVAYSVDRDSGTKVQLRLANTNAYQALPEVPPEPEPQLDEVEEEIL